MESGATGDASGWEVLRVGLEKAHAELGRRLVAAYALGSLAHGGFCPAVSDVDLALILDELEGEIGPLMGRVQSQVMSQLGSAPAARLSIFWSTWQALRSDGSAGRFPLADQLDLVNSGVLLFGVDRRGDLHLPGPDVLRRRLVVEAAEFMLRKLSAGPSAPLPLDISESTMLTCRDVTKAVLFPVRFIYTAECGGIATNPAAVDHYCTQDARPSKQLVMSALRWRESGRLERPEEVRSALARGLAPLYLELIRVYVEALRAEGSTSLEHRLLSWATDLSRVA